jgi:hypothetical protein
VVHHNINLVPCSVMDPLLESLIQKRVELICLNLLKMLSQIYIR